MIETVIDFDLTENYDENIFDNFMSTVERLNLSGETSIEESKKLENLVLKLERNVQDLTDLSTEFNSLILNNVKRILSDYNKILIHSQSNEMLGLAFNTFQTLNNSIYHYQHDNAFNKLVDVTNRLSISNNLNGNLSSLENIKKTAFIGLTSLEYEYSYVNNLFDNILYESSEILINFKTKENETHKPLEFIYQFIEILNKIEGVRVEIEEIKKGSLVVTLRAYFNSKKAKDDACELLEGAKKFASGKLEKEYEEKEKIKEEKLKINVEKKILQQELDQSVNLDSLYLKALNIKQSEEDLKRKQLENIKLGLEVLKDSRDLFTELIGEGFVSQSDFDMFINQIPFLQKIDGKLTVGENALIDKKDQN
ncbi:MULTISPECIES: hypothetical protein [Flavobacterium]|uniref:Uncharacterized protein n=1 Tax=Flavobacterium tructae TaxID=1114873 RepID=A0A1S1J6Y5_9FLAO|nr:MULTISPECIES: hypothetical protein [Flavobacterium]OHT46412.1 hypothetical protein BHE19_02590 [Flavobacterium tructae]OXB22374.1 hypothetical protein B0A71_02635 [Flavobacterium tructae]URC13789.1 hypothetical protein M4I44_05155 [Flavobacterium sp. B183]